MKKIILGLMSLLLVTTMLGRPAMAANSTTYAQTKYPIVLVHGFLGWSTMVGVWDYFNHIPTALKNDGASVYVVQLSQTNSDAVRGEQLLAQVQQILATSGAKKVNLIGHSMGGLDSRYVAGVRPDLVASVTTVGTPHRGSPVADVIMKPGSFNQAGVTDLIAGLGQLMGSMSGNTTLPQDSKAALNSLTTAGTTAFNAQFPAGVPKTCSGNGDLSKNGIKFYSWGGVGVLTSLLDPTDLLFGMTGMAFVGSPDQDGMVARCSNHFGLIIKDNYIMNHLDSVNQILGLVSIFAPNPVTLFEQHANRLKLAGL